MDSFIKTVFEAVSNFFVAISGSFTLELIGRVILACVCGAAIGVERTTRLKEAGIRTHTIVALGSALIMVVSKYGFADIGTHFVGNFDASRIASCVVTGISFLGAGTIFVRGNAIKGLTTSAGIWATAGIGLALGSGMYAVGISATVILIFAQLLLHRFVGGLDNISVSEVSVTAIYTPDVIAKLKNMFAEQGITVQNCHASKGKDNTVELKMTVKSSKELEFDNMVHIFEHNENIISFSL